MTRINLVPPSELYDQHLVAEYREFLMVPASLKRSLASPNFDENKLPKTFVLNKGHVSFFYTRGLFLLNRYTLLVDEMLKRGMHPNPDRKFPIDVFPKKYQNDWIPDEKDINISRQRIMLRVAEKPSWYRKTKYK